ncbi:P-loop containing nucleoside triphosphate hydrolase protein [Boletus edulis]|nr:P-loop containing nucleoside triphosphate hydrolase protein [Boletus edulis]
MTTVQKIKEVEDEMARTQKNKATSYHLGQLKAKLAKLRRELISPSGGGGGGGGIGFDVARTGVASVGFVGFPSVGKSTLMSKLTGTHSEVSEIDFTTLTTVPGTVKVHGAPIQILDLPGIIEGANDGRGRGRQGKYIVCTDNIVTDGLMLVIAVARTCNLIFIVLDVLKPLGDKKTIQSELEGFGIRLNKRPPAIMVRKKDKGGIAITNTVPLTNIDHDEIKAVLSEYKLSNADVTIREPNCTSDDLVDVIEGNRQAFVPPLFIAAHTATRVYIPALYVLNKIDAISIEELDLLYKIPNSVPVSSKEWMNIDELIEKMWEALQLVRVYTKPRGQSPDYSTPVVLRRGRCTVDDFCNTIHKEIAKQMKYAIVWGSSAKHARGQKVGLDHVLEDEDVVHISKR